MLFSATFPEEVVANINKFLPEYRPFLIKPESLKLKGVKMFRMEVDESKKIDFIKDIYLEFE